MTLSQRDAIELFGIIEKLEQRVEDLESIVNESREFVVSNSFPSNGFAGQVILRTDQPGTNGGGTLYRFDQGLNTWLQV